MSPDHRPIKELQFENARFLPEVVALLEEGHTVTLRLKGFSMRPFLEDNRDKALLSMQKGISFCIASSASRAMRLRCAATEI